MDFNHFKEIVFLLGRDKFDDLELYRNEEKTLSIHVFNGEIDKYAIAESSGVSFRGLKDGKMGYAFSETLDEASARLLVEQAYDNAKYIDTTDLTPIFEPSDEYMINNQIKNKIDEVSIDEKIELMKKLEKTALSLDKRITSLQSCIYEEYNISKEIYNSKGLDMKEAGGGAVIYMGVVAKDDNDTKTGSALRMFRDFKDIDIEDIAKESVNEAVSLLNAKPIKSNDYTTIIKGNVFADILEAFFPTFSAENAQKGLSQLKDKTGEVIASDVFTILEDPLCEMGFALSTFDDEGNATMYKKIVENGKLNTLLYNGKAALKAGVAPTGNGFRESYKTPISTKGTNILVKIGEKSLDELVSNIDNGVLVTHVAGLHSGLNPVSGDFSMQAQGFLIEEGKITKGINGVTVAGNFFSMLMDIEEVGSDIKFGFPSGSHFGSPSIKLKKLSIAGS